MNNEEKKSNQNMEKKISSNIRWLIMALIALIAAGGGAVSWLGIFDEKDDDKIKKAVVVLMDTYVTHKAYDPDLQKNGLSNAHFIEKQILGNDEIKKRIHPEVEIVGLSFEGKSRIVRHNPVLVVMHRSTFDTEKATDAGDQKLKAFLSDMSASSASVLVYSRKPHTDPAFASNLGIATGLGDRVHTYQFQPGNPFADKDQVNHFINTIDRLVKEEIDQ